MIRALFATLLHPVFHARDVLERVAGSIGNLRDLVREAMVFGADRAGEVERALRVEAHVDGVPRLADSVHGLEASAAMNGAELVRIADALERGNLLAEEERGRAPHDGRDMVLERIAVALERANRLRGSERCSAINGEGKRCTLGPGHEEHDYDEGPAAPHVHHFTFRRFSPPAEPGEGLLCACGAEAPR